MLQQYVELEPVLVRAEASGVPSIPGSFSMPASPRSPMGVLSRGSSGIRCSGLVSLVQGWAGFLAAHAIGGESISAVKEAGSSRTAHFLACVIIKIIVHHEYNVQRLS